MTNPTTFPKPHSRWTQTDWDRFYEETPTLAALDWLWLSGLHAARVLSSSEEARLLSCIKALERKPSV